MTATVLEHKTEKLQEKRKPLIYLASPHSHLDPFVREQRCQLVMRAWVYLFELGKLVFSPILHTHEAAKDYLGLENGFELYRELDERMISVCDEVWILAIEGWKESVGVQAEIAYAKSLGKEVKVVGFYWLQRVPSSYLIWSYEPMNIESMQGRMVK